MSRINEVEIQLTTPLENVNIGGSAVQVDRLTLKCPKGKHRKQSSQLSYFWNHAIKNSIAFAKSEMKEAIEKEEAKKEADSKTKDSKDEKAGWESTMMMLSMYLDEPEDLEKCFELFCTLAINGCAVISKDTKLTADLVGEIDLPDLERMLGEFITSFLQRSR